jgi:hypothetical protein
MNNLLNLHFICKEHQKAPKSNNDFSVPSPLILLINQLLKLGQSFLPGNNLKAGPLSLI